MGFGTQGVFCHAAQGINTELKDIPKKNLKPIWLMEFILYPILLAYIVLSAYEQGLDAFWPLFWNAFIINLSWNFGDLFLRDWWLRAKYTDRVMNPGTEGNSLCTTNVWMKKFGIFDHWVKGPILCALLSAVLSGIGMLIRGDQR